MRKRFSVFVIALFAIAGCNDDGDPDAECLSAGDCQEAEAPCDGCPLLGEAICLQGMCEDTPAVDLDITANIRIEPRQLEVASLVHAIVYLGATSDWFSCADAFASDGRIDPSMPVISTGYKNLSGGAQHNDVQLGRAPQESLVVAVILGTDRSTGDGNVIAQGCTDILEVGTQDVAVNFLELTGI